MRRFGVIKALPPVRFKAAWPGGRWLPERLLQRLPPRRLGACQVVSVGGAAARGMVWVGCHNGERACRLPRLAQALTVVGLEGWPAGVDLPAGPALFTTGDALELGLFLEALPSLAAGRGLRLGSLRIVIGGCEPYRLGVTARLLARDVGELVMVGRWPSLPRLAGQILGESGLAVQVKRGWPVGGWDLAVWCGPLPTWGHFDITLFNPARRLRTAPSFSWQVLDGPPLLAEELASFAAAEAFLLAVDGGERTGKASFPFSLAWVGYIRKLAKELGLYHLPASLDTAMPVGYNNY
ncbi:MAG TPA: hypothetical protein PLI94_05940 [Bacillota bacterium]|nr:hypothetical protein [Bacillota bacterium]HPT67560.1 hypothetical protein [Bacillota bacterium]